MERKTVVRLRLDNLDFPLLEAGVHQESSCLNYETSLSLRPVSLIFLQKMGSGQMTELILAACKEMPCRNNCRREHSQLRYELTSYT